MHMWMWFGYDLGPFLFAGLDITSRWTFALTWIALFIIALLFEASKVYLAKVQRETQKKLSPYRSYERRNLLCQEQGALSEPGTSRNASTGQVGRWGSFRTRVLVNVYQSFVFMIHNTVGYLLMLAVMVYNVHLLLAVVFGTMLGYFLFGAKLTRLQMQCFRTKRVVICTPECDDTDRCNKEKCSWDVCEGKLCKKMDAMELQQQDTILKLDTVNNYVRYSVITDSTTPSLLDASSPDSGDYLVCQTRTCIQPSHYFRAGTSQSPACQYGAKSCHSKVARLKDHDTKGCGDERSVQQQLLGESCCKKEQVEAVQRTCCEEGSSSQATVREESPQVTCCRAKSTPTDSQEQIV